MLVFLTFKMLSLNKKSSQHLRLANCTKGSTSWLTTAFLRRRSAVNVPLLWWNGVSDPTSKLLYRRRRNSWSFLALPGRCSFSLGHSPPPGVRPKGPCPLSLPPCKQTVTNLQMILTLLHKDFILTWFHKENILAFLHQDSILTLLHQDSIHPARLETSRPAFLASHPRPNPSSLPNSPLPPAV